MTSRTNKVLLIGLDGATFDLLDPLMAAGYLPHLSDLKARGTWGKLASTIPPFTAAAWSTLITGQNPGQHGIISFSSTRDRFNYELTGQGFVNAQRFEHTLWEILSAAGKRVCVANVPLTYPARPVNGYMITGMLTPLESRQFTYPPDLANRLGQDYAIDVDFIRDGEQFRLHGLPSKSEMLPAIRRMTHARAEVCQRLLIEEAWDFFMVVFTGTDRISHFFWDDLETITAVSPTPLQKDLIAYFQELDQAIGNLVAQASSDTIVMLMSDHGFGPAPDRRFYINVWLEKLRLLQPRSANGLFDLEFWRTKIGRNKYLKTILRRLIPQSTQDAVKTATESISGDIVAWNQTQAYFAPIYFHVCGVEVNLVGERRQGIVPSGDVYEALRDRIIEEAKQLRDPETGKKIVDKAARREDLFHGRYVSEFPDVILILNPSYVGAGSLAGGSLFEPHSHPVRPGEHREDGIFIATGPNIEPNDALANLMLVDLPSTILYTLGIPVPSVFDGHVLTDLFKPEFLNSHPIEMKELLPISKTSDSNKRVFSGEQERQLEKRLRGLGYLE